MFTDVQISFTVGAEHSGSNAVLNASKAKLQTSQGL